MNGADKKINSRYPITQRELSMVYRRESREKLRRFVPILTIFR